MPVSNVADVPSPRLVLAVDTLFRSLRLLAIASLLVSVLTTFVSCEPSTAGNPVASSTTIFPLAVPVSNVAAVPKPRLVLAVPALSRSLRLLVVISTFVGSVLSILSILPFDTVPPISSLITR